MPGFDDDLSRLRHFQDTNPEIVEGYKQLRQDCLQLGYDVTAVLTAFADELDEETKSHKPGTAVDTADLIRRAIDRYLSTRK